MPRNRRCSPSSTSSAPVADDTARERFVEVTPDPDPDAYVLKLNP
jgi:hypothetical protein